MNINITKKPKLIAFYLTQFHPIPENDEWWGKGFTEWTNVTKAKPLFDSHYQPHLPTNFGFYDLRVRETRHDQISTAKKFGIDGFCYHYYWFSGRRLLNKPLDDMLFDQESDMPFCLCWANENWSRRWDAAEHEILIAQEYLPDDDINFIKSLIPFFTDPRYIKIDGKLFLIVYRVQNLPDPLKTVNVWRNYCREQGLGELHLCAALTHGNEKYESYGFDSGVEFPPHNLKIPNINNSIDFNEKFTGNVFNYTEIANFYINKKYNNDLVYKTVFPSWDNTSRRNNNALIVVNSSPENYEFWLKKTFEKISLNNNDEFVFINAWNEWAEGCHLEPDRAYGEKFLAATLTAKNGFSDKTEFHNFNVTKSVGHKSKESFSRDLYMIFEKHTLRFIWKMKDFIHTTPWLYKFLFPIVNFLRKFIIR